MAEFVLVSPVKKKATKIVINVSSTAKVKGAGISFLKVFSMKLLRFKLQSLVMLVELIIH